MVSDSLRNADEKVYLKKSMRWFFCQNIRWGLLQLRRWRKCTLLWQIPVCYTSAKSDCCIQILSVSHVPGITLCRAPKSRWALLSLSVSEPGICLSQTWNCHLQNSCQPSRYPGVLCRHLSCPKSRDPPAWSTLIWWDGWSRSGQWWLESVTSAKGWGCAWLTLQPLVLFWNSWRMELILSSLCYLGNRDHFSVSCTHLWPKTCAQPGGSQWKVMFPTAQHSLASSRSSLCCFNSMHFIFKDLTQISVKSLGLHIWA